ncbi:hypothetical protein A3E39_00090 [Candidatus Uhrbacteria bacterium RIFCSPHIGHO2_12_FULL_60_25]|uniref:Uncharacterized protein n=1 Tax=Candidatus Uhrbacteria bacterium RIFCSPHIGHO2_12_FULL_60_25 TaxID=1802399 RepID=A0A1F7UMJ7_9BACT|nr:MAG: hypothetical protein A3D73_02695 [Candidatus Uhrbacteria bacterium RIFCSPHIGHO2_02_FULL_60_44]OGL79506.1 MAG: hypothetical protein A3E39_00090 [Candidatus Uhrbacteria bacterium RIFCSPHIGHO2_12_FULL_60_25]
MKDTVVQSSSEMNDEEIRKLIVARLSVLSSDTYASIGSEGSFSRDEMIRHVEAGDEIGKKIEEIQMEWLRSWKEKAQV